MIIDRIENSQRVEVLHPYFKLAFNYLKTHDLLSLVSGREDRIGNEAYLKVKEYREETGNRAICRVFPGRCSCFLYRRGVFTQNSD